MLRGLGKNEARALSARIAASGERRFSAAESRRGMIRSRRPDYRIHRVLQASCVDQSGRGLERHVPSRYFIYGHEEVLENRFQSNWNGTRVEPVPRYERGTLSLSLSLFRTCLYLACLSFLICWRFSRWHVLAFFESVRRWESPSRRWEFEFLAFDSRIEGWRDQFLSWLKKGHGNEEDRDEFVYLLNFMRD